MENNILNELLDNLDSKDNVLLSIIKNKFLENIIRMKTTFEVEKEKWNDIFNEIGTYCDYGNDYYNRNNEGQIYTNKSTSNKLRDKEYLMMDNTIMNVVDISSAKMFGLIFGDGEFFNLRDLDGNINEILYIIEQFLLRDFNKSDFELVCNSIIRDFKNLYGNSAFLVKVNKEYFKDNKKSFLNIEKFNIRDFILADDDNLFLKKSYYGFELYNDDFRLSDDLFSRIKTNQTEKVEVNFFVMKNTIKDYMMDDIKYVGIYFTDDRHILRIETYSYNPIVIAKSDVKNGQIYGRSICMRMLPTIRFLNGLNNVSIDSITRMISSPLGAYIDAFMGKKDVNLYNDKVNWLAQGAFNGNPIFPIQKQVQDPTNILKFLKDELRQEIYNAFSIDSMTDQQLTTSGATLGEVQIRQSNSNLLIYQQINTIFKKVIKPIIDISIQLVVDNWDALFPNLTLPQLLQEQIFNKKEWYKIINKKGMYEQNNQKDIQNINYFNQFLQGVMQQDPAIASIIKVYDVVNDYQTKLGLEGYIGTKTEYEINKKILAEAQAQQQMAEAQNGQ